MIASVIVLAMLGAAPVRAAPDGAEALVAGSGACPRPGAVADALRALAAPDEMSRLESGGVRPIAEVVDLGPGYAVLARERRREYPDPQRRCDERARVAAVFVALMLDIPLAAERPPEAPPAPAVTAVTIEAAAILDAAPEGSDLRWGAGGKAIVGPSGARWGLLASAQAFLPATVVLGPVRARQSRFPLALGARVWLPARALALWGEAAAVGALVHTRNDDGQGPRAETRLDPGMAAALGARVRMTPRFGPFVGATFAVFPRRYRYVADPIGPVGESPRFWLGLSLGVALSFF